MKHALIFAVVAVFFSICLSDGQLSDYHQDYYYQQGMDLYNAGDYSSAIQSFDMVTQSDDQAEDAWYFKGMCYFNLESYRDAVQCFANAVTIDPNDFYNCYYLGRALLSLGDYNNAVNFLLLFNRD